MNPNLTTDPNLNTATKYNNPGVNSSDKPEKVVDFQAHVTKDDSTRKVREIRYASKELKEDPAIVIAAIRGYNPFI